jgi:hypothetical protein
VPSAWRVSSYHGYLWGAHSAVLQVVPSRGLGRRSVTTQRRWWRAAWFFSRLLRFVRYSFVVLLWFLGRDSMSVLYRLSQISFCRANSKHYLYIFNRNEIKIPVIRASRKTTPVLQVCVCVRTAVSFTRKTRMEGSSSSIPVDGFQ